MYQDLDTYPSIAVFRMSDLELLVEKNLVFTDPFYVTGVFLAENSLFLNYEYYSMGQMSLLAIDSSLSLNIVNSIEPFVQILNDTHPNNIWDFTDSGMINISNSDQS